MPRPSVARTRDGYRLEISRDIDAEPIAAWELLVEPRRWPEWGPSVRAVDCDDDRIQAGSTGRVRLPGGLWLPFEIEAYTELAGEQPGHWRWRVAKIPATGHRVESSGVKTRVVFEIPLAAAGYAPVCHRALDRIESIVG
ncbi:SRPBCC family protein [Halobacteriaceae archaeon SHR40]|uniref:SRPBCC family protein n=1 Tax=Halovenus amylolytica TaxID=2500550 RepID=UPI000FE4415F